MPVHSFKEFVEKAGYDRAERLERFNRLAESEITVEQGAKELTRRRREQEGEPPLVEVKVKADGPLILKQATDDVQYSRGLALRERLLNSGHTEDEVVSVGHQMLAGNDPLNPPPTEVGLVDREGKEFKKLGDRVRVGQELSVHKATELVQNWRQQQAEQQRELLATLQAGEQKCWQRRRQKLRSPRCWHSNRSFMSRPTRRLSKSARNCRPKGRLLRKLEDCRALRSP